jgi:hypothetical protein
VLRIHRIDRNKICIEPYKYTYKVQVPRQRQLSENLQGTESDSNPNFPMFNTLRKDEDMISDCKLLMGTH